jgi:predicted Zn-ribbon and HTH transcriptional regulator
MIEKLTCNQCGKGWRREKTRGRKPHICPKCSSAAIKKQKLNVVPIQQVKSISIKKHFPILEPLYAQASKSQQNKNELTIGEVYNYYHPSHPNAQEFIESTRKGSTWRCTSCKYEFKVYLPISAPPTHKCSENGRSHPCKRTDK